MGHWIIEVGDISGEKSSTSPLTGREYGSWGLELDDSPGPEVRALFGGGVLQDGRR